MPAAQLNADLRARTRELQRDLYRARGQYRRFSGDLRKQFAGLGRAARLATGVLIAGMAAAARETLKVADETAKAARNAGLAAKEYQRLEHAFRIGGSSGAALVKGVQTVARTVNYAGDELKTYTRELDKLGLSYEDLIKLAPGDAFRLLRDRLSEVENPLTRMAIATTIFGRAGKEMGSILELNAEQFGQLEDRIENLGGVIGGNLLGRAESLNDELATLAQVIKAQVATAILSSLSATQNWDDAIRSAGEAARKLTDGVINLGRWLVEHRGTVVKVLTAYVSLRTVAFGTRLVRNIAGVTAALIAMRTAMTAATAAGVALNASAFFVAAPWIALAGAIGLVATAATRAAKAIREARKERERIRTTPIGELSREDRNSAFPNNRLRGGNARSISGRRRAAAAAAERQALEAGPLQEIRVTATRIGDSLKLAREEIETAAKELQQIRVNVRPSAAAAAERQALEAGPLQEIRVTATRIGDSLKLAREEIETAAKELQQIRVNVRPSAAAAAERQALEAGPLQEIRVTATRIGDSLKLAREEIETAAKELQQIRVNVRPSAAAAAERQALEAGPLQETRVTATRIGDSLKLAREEIETAAKELQQIRVNVRPSAAAAAERQALEAGPLQEIRVTATRIGDSLKLAREEIETAAKELQQIRVNVRPSAAAAAERQALEAGPLQETRVTATRIGDSLKLAREEIETAAKELQQIRVNVRPSAAAAAERQALEAGPLQEIRVTATRIGDSLKLAREEIETAAKELQQIRVNVRPSAAAAAERQALEAGPLQETRVTATRIGDSLKLAREEIETAAKELQQIRVNVRPSAARARIQQDGFLAGKDAIGDLNARDRSRLSGQNQLPEIQVTARQVGAQIAQGLAEQRSEWAKLGASIQESLSYNLTRAIAGGNWASLRQIFLSSVIEALIGGAVKKGVSSIFGGLFGGVFHNEGVIPGNPGEEKLVLARAGEAVGYPGGSQFGGPRQEFNFYWQGGGPTQADRIALQNAVRDAADVAAYEGSG